MRAITAECDQLNMILHEEVAILQNDTLSWFAECPSVDAENRDLSRARPILTTIATRDAR
jgi:hypothetical protein